MTRDRVLVRELERLLAEKKVKVWVVVRFRVRLKVRLKVRVRVRARVSV